MRALSKRAWVCGIVLGVSLLMAGRTFAQQRERLPSFAQRKAQPPASMPFGDIIAMMKEKLNLSDEQVSQITPIVQDDIRQRQEIMAKAKASGAGRNTVKSQMAALRERTKSKIAQYLTPEQLAKLQNEPPSPDSNANGNKTEIGDWRNPETRAQWSKNANVSRILKSYRDE